MAEQGACDVRAKECKPCGRQMRAKNQRSGQRREKNLDGRIEDENKKQEVGEGSGGLIMHQRVPSLGF